MTKFPDTHHDIFSNTVFGFWVYLMTDAILFVTLFATYAVLHGGTNGGPTSQDLFNLPSALSETVILLASSFACGMAMLAASRKEKSKMLWWFILVFFLGIAFLILEVSDFQDLITQGDTWTKSAFLSAYFTLVGTHGLHILGGLLFLLLFLLQFLDQGFTPVTLRRLTCFSMFWYFSYVVWIFMFTLVYLFGAIA